jgi:hypothetical protein
MTVVIDPFGWNYTAVKTKRRGYLHGVKIIVIDYAA